MASREIILIASCTLRSSLRYEEGNRKQDQSKLDSDIGIHFTELCERVNKESFELWLLWVEKYVFGRTGIVNSSDKVENCEGGRDVIYVNRYRNLYP